MLVLGTETDEYLAIGEIICRIQRRGRSQRIAIDAPRTMRILRFDANGKLLSRSRVVAILTQGDDPTIPDGTVRLHLACGHVMDWTEAHPQGPVDCTECITAATALGDRIARMAVQTGGVDLSRLGRRGGNKKGEGK